MHTIPGLQYFCMTPYDASFKGVHILFDKENVNNTLGEFLANVGKTQLHIAETEKYAHVTSSSTVAVRLRSIARSVSWSLLLKWLLTT